METLSFLLPVLVGTCNWTVSGTLSLKGKTTRPRGKLVHSMFYARVDSFVDSWLFLTSVLRIVLATSNAEGRDDRFPSGLATHGTVFLRTLTLHRQPTHKGFLFQGNDEIAVSRAFVTNPDFT